MKYLRLYAGEDGESHVEEMLAEFDLQQYAPPAPAFGIVIGSGKLTQAAHRI